MWDGVDGGGDGIAGIEHGVELGDGVSRVAVGVEEMGGDGVQDELAASAGDEPVVCEGDGDF